MKEKSDFTQIFINFHKMIQTQYNTSIKVLRSDNGREYTNVQLQTYLQQHGIIHQTSCINTPQQNGTAERKNRHLLDVTRALMLTNNVPKYYWGEAILTATYLINRLPSKTLTYSTPFDLLSKAYPTAPLLNHLPEKVFGCTAYVHNDNGGKLDPRAIKCIFVGYSPTQRGYRCYSPTQKKFYTTMNVTFAEHLPFYPKTPIQGESLRE